jgi:hypothetical protein
MPGSVIAIAVAGRSVAKDSAPGCRYNRDESALPERMTTCDLAGDAEERPSQA